MTLHSQDAIGDSRNRTPRAASSADPGRPRGICRDNLAYAFHDLGRVFETHSWDGTIGGRSAASGDAQRDLLAVDGDALTELLRLGKARLDVPERNRVLFLKASASGPHERGAEAHCIAH